MRLHPSASLLPSAEQRYITLVFRTDISFYLAFCQNFQSVLLHSALKAFRAIGAVLGQIESLHKTELEASREGRVFPVCLCSDFLVP